MGSGNLAIRIARGVGGGKRALLVIPVLLLLVGWLLNVPGGILGKADAVGYAVCHRIEVRSFHLGDRPIPLCARCSGMYLGAMSGLIYQAIVYKRRGGMPDKKILAVFGLFLIAFAGDGLNSYMSFFPNAPTLYEPQNWLRLVTGTGMGLAIAGVIFPAFNQTVWAGWDRRPTFVKLTSLPPLLIIAILVDVLVLTENPLVLYPLAIISASGVLVLLTLVYGMVWLMISKAENSIARISQLIIPLTVGFGMALLQIIVFDGLRFALTGTWEGFHLG